MSSLACFVPPADSSIIVTIFVSFLNLGRLTTILTFAYTFSANAFFLVSVLITLSRASPDRQLRSLKYVLLPDPSSASAVTIATLSHSQRSRRIQFLFFMAVSQILWMGWLSLV